MKEWKKQCNRGMRRISEEKEIPNGKYYKKVNDIWASPSDGKWFRGGPEWRRK